MRVNVRRWEMHRDGEGIAVVPSCTSKYFIFHNYIFLLSHFLESTSTRLGYKTVDPVQCISQL